MIKIVVDAMGGDNAPDEIVKGAVDSLKVKDGFKVVLTGDKERIEAVLATCGKYDENRIEVVHASEVITNDDIPTKAIKTKKDSSLVVAMNMLKTDDEVGALVSAGSTGAVLTGGVLMIGRLKGISRPALCPAIPNYRGSQTLLCDCGANVECKPINFAHFAIMASAYCKMVLGIKDPKVGLLSNGTEDHKGDPLHQEANELLKKIKGINYVGNVEGRDIMYGDVDVVVCDGFTGNIALKSLEGCGKAVKTILTKEYKRNIFTMICALLSKNIIKGVSAGMDYSALGGAVFLGMKKVIVKGHGSSKAKSVAPSIIQAYDAYMGGVTNTISEMLSETDFDEIAKIGEGNV